MTRLPPSHAAATDGRANALTIVSIILVELWNLKQVHPQLRGSYDVIKNLVVCL